MTAATSLSILIIFKSSKYLIYNSGTERTKMARQHIHRLGEATVGDTVQVPVPDVNRGPGDVLHVLAYIIKINQQNMA